MAILYATVTELKVNAVQVNSARVWGGFLESNEVIFNVLGARFRSVALPGWERGAHGYRHENTR